MEPYPDPYPDPPIFRYWVGCWEQQPVMMAVAMPIGTLAGAVAIVLAARQQVALRRCPVSVERQCYLRCSGLPLVYAVCNLAQLLTAPAASSLTRIILRQYTAFALAGFATLILELLARESGALQESTASHESSGVGKQILVALASQGPKKHFVTPPCCCYFAPCVREHHLSSAQLLRAFALLRQYVVAIPTLAILTLWVRLVYPGMVNRYQFAAHSLAFLLSKISEVLALWGLVVLYRATRSLLKRWHTTKKFVSLKLLIFVETVQSTIMGLVVRAIAENRKLCLDADHMVELWCCFFMLIESVILALFMARAFPTEEVASRSHNRTSSLGTVELDLRYHLQQTVSGRLLDEERMPASAPEAMSIQACPASPVPA